MVKCAVDAAKVIQNGNCAEKVRNNRDGHDKIATDGTYAGHRPTRPTSLLKENGEMTRRLEKLYCNGTIKILNVPSQYHQVIAAMTACLPNSLILLHVMSCR